MADLEKTIDTPENSEGTTVSNTGNDFNLDFTDSLTPDPNQTTQETTQHEILQNEPEPTPTNINSEIPVENSQINSINSFSEGNTIAQEPLEVSSENNATNESLNSLGENTINLQPEVAPIQPETNNVFLGSFENNMNNPTNNEEVHNNIDNSTLLDHSAILENPILDSNNQEEEKNKLIQKEKLAHLIKAHESKAKKSGFLKGILSGVVVMIAIIFVSFLFAKDQVIDIINMVNDKSPSLSANVVNIADSQNEEVENNDDNMIDDENVDDESVDDENVDDENVDDENVDDENVDDENIDDENIDDENVDDEMGNNELNEDYIQEDRETFEKYFQQIEEIMNNNMENKEKLAILEQFHKEIFSMNPENEELKEFIEDSVTKIYEEIAQEEANKNITENNNENSNEKEYSVIHVNSEEEANWVMPAHCSDLTCYGTDKEFTPCTTFRLSENLDENANRIGNNGTCRYKDASELVYVEFN